MKIKTKIKDILEYMLIIGNVCASYIIKKIIFFIIKICNDKMLFLVNNKIQYNIIDSSSDSDDSNSDSDEFNNTYNNIKIMCNTNRTIFKYMTIYNKYGKYESNECYIINSFLFNVNKNEDMIINNTPFTKKLILLYMFSNMFNSKVIRGIYNKYNFLYILYKTTDNQFKIKIIDLFNGYEILTNTRILFNNIKL